MNKVMSVWCVIYIENYTNDSAGIWNFRLNFSLKHVAGGPTQITPTCTHRHIKWDVIRAFRNCTLYNMLQHEIKQVHQLRNCSLNTAPWRRVREYISSLGTTRSAARSGRIIPATHWLVEWVSPEPVRTKRITPSSAGTRTLTEPVIN
jgi:hypothetical protein